MTEVIDGFVCTVTENNIHIKDSYKCTDRNKMNEILYAIQYNNPQCKVFEIRKWNNLISEGKCHNRLYRCGIKRNQTGSVDLDIYEPWGRRVLYSIIGM